MVKEVEEGEVEEAGRERVGGEGGTGGGGEGHEGKEVEVTLYKTRPNSPYYIFKYIKRYILKL